MRIATWNINGLRARLDFVVLWLRARQPDIVGLQELKLTDEQFPHEVFEAEGYHALTHGQKAWNGVAILSRTPAAVTQTGLPGQEEFGARLITAHVEGIDFTTVYCPNGKNLEHDDYHRKLLWFDALAEHWAASHDAASAAVLCGDLNLCPGPLDSCREPEYAGIFHTAAERQRYQALLDTGLLDLFREHHRDKKMFSWWDYRGGSFHRNLGLRIDFLLGTRSIMDRLESIQTDREYRKKHDGLTASDHAPVIAELR